MRLLNMAPLGSGELGDPDALRHRLKLYLDRERGNRTRALARYNGSVGKVWYPQLVYKALSKRWYRQ